METAIVYHGYTSNHGKEMETTTVCRGLRILGSAGLLEVSGLTRGKLRLPYGL